MSTAIVYVLTSECAWRDLPALVRDAVPDRAPSLYPVDRGRALGLWREFHHVLRDQLGSRGLLDWCCAIVGDACVRAKKGSRTGPSSPVDRGKPGSKIHVLCDRGGLPLTVAISASNTHDSLALKPLVMAIPSVKSRRGPRRGRTAKLHADKAYDQPHCDSG